MAHRCATLCVTSTDKDQNVMCTPLFEETPYWQLGHTLCYMPLLVCLFQDLKHCIQPCKAAMIMKEAAELEIV